MMSYLDVLQQKIDDDRARLERDKVGVAQANERKLVELQEVIYWAKFARPDYLKFIE